MKKVVEEVYLAMYQNDKDINFTEMLLVCVATFGVIFGTLFTVLVFI